MGASVLVVNPWVTDFKLYDEWMHPVGLYFLISLLLSRGAHVNYIDCLSRDPVSKSKPNGTGEFPSREITKPALYAGIRRRYKIYGCSEQDVLRAIGREPRPDVICVGSMMTYWIDGLQRTVSVLKRACPGVPIVVGGVAARLIPAILEARLGKGCSAGGPITVDGTVSGFPPGLPPPFPLTGVPRNELSMVEAFDRVRPRFHGPVLTALGCPFNCSYCASRALTPSYSPRPVEAVLREVSYLATNFGIRDFAFLDDALLYNSETGFVPLTNALIAGGPPLRFHTPNGLHARYLDEKSLEAMKRGGFVTMRLGYESGAPGYRDDTSAKAGWHELERAVSMAEAAGFSRKQIGVYVMAGLYRQKPTEMIAELRRVASLGVTVKPVFLSPVPGTRLYETYAAQFPQLRTNPLWHNDTFFVTRLEHWGDEAVEEVRLTARELNSAR